MQGRQFLWSRTKHGYWLSLPMNLFGSIPGTSKAALQRWILSWFNESWFNESWFNETWCNEHDAHRDDGCNGGAPRTRDRKDNGTSAEGSVCNFDERSSPGVA
jgi:hypothetical protein